MSDSSKRWLGVAVAAFLLWAVFRDRDEPRPVVPPPTYSGYGDTGYGDTGYGDTGYGDTGYGDTGYGNPAPGDDGSPDCAPGQGPVYVGSNDPYGLDGDGDGIGCE